MTILSGYVATPVPGPLTVDTQVPGPVVVATEIPGPTVVPTPVPFWLREIFVYLAAEGEITVQVGGIRMGSTEAIVRGNGRVAAAVSSVWLSAPEQLLTGLGRLEVLARFGANAGTKLLEGVGSVVLSSFAPKLPAGVRTLAGQGAVIASNIAYRLRPGPVSLAGRGAVTASVTRETMNAGTRTPVAGRGAVVVASISQKLSLPEFLTASSDSKTNANATVTMTLSQAATLVMVGTSNIGSDVLPTLNGSTTGVTRLGATGSMGMWICQVPAGTHTLSYAPSGSFRTLDVSAYIGVSTWSAATSGSGTSTTPTAASSAADGLVVAGFVGSTVAAANTSGGSGTTIRVKQVADGYTYLNITMADALAPPATLTATTSAAWTAMAIRLL